MLDKDEDDEIVDPEITAFVGTNSGATIGLPETVSLDPAQIKNPDRVLTDEARESLRRAENACRGNPEAQKWLRQNKGEVYKGHLPRE